MSVIRTNECILSNSPQGRIVKCLLILHMNMVSSLVFVTETASLGVIVGVTASRMRRSMSWAPLPMVWNQYRTDGLLPGLCHAVCVCVCVSVCVCVCARERASE